MSDYVLVPREATREMISPWKHLQGPRVYDVYQDMIAKRPSHCDALLKAMEECCAIVERWKSLEDEYVHEQESETGTLKRRGELTMEYGALRRRRNEALSRLSAAREKV